MSAPQGYQSPSRQQAEQPESKPAFRVDPRLEKSTNWLEIPPPPPALIEPWIPWGHMTLLCGPGGVGKSQLVIQTGLTATLQYPEWIEGSDRLARWRQEILDENERLKAEGKPMISASRMPSPYPAYSLDERSQVQSVIYVTYEDPVDRIAERIPPSFKDDQFQLLTDHNLRTYHYKEPIWSASKIKFDQGQGAEDGFTLYGHYLKEEQARTGAKLVIIDPLALAFAGDENSRQHAGAFCQAMNAWAEEADMCVLVVAHPNKSGEDLSGSSQWMYGPRAVLSLRRRSIAEEVVRELCPGRKAAPLSTLKDNMMEVPHATVLTLEKANATAPGATLFLASQYDESGTWNRLFGCYTPSEAAFEFAKHQASHLQPGSLWNPSKPRMVEQLVAGAPKGGDSAEVAAAKEEVALADLEQKKARIELRVREDALKAESLAEKEAKAAERRRAT